MQANNQNNGLIERIYWLIRLRWIAVAGVVLTISFTDRMLGIPLALVPLYGITIWLGVYNLCFLIYLKRIDKKPLPNLQLIGNRIANSQISLDLLSLAALIHFSGGIENPFIFYFIFHMIIASILLSRKASFLQANLTVVLFCSVVFLEYFAILPHYSLEGFSAYGLYANLIYIAGVSFVFVSTLYIAVYMATSISVRLRQREKSLYQANALLLEKDRAKSEYVLRVSHDIKEHLAAVQSCIEPVTRGITGALNARQMDLLQRADNRTGKLLFFVKALLEISRIKLSRQIKKEYLSIQELIQSAVNYIEESAKNKGLVLNTYVDPQIEKILGYRPYIEETILNLLANSVKYTPPGGKIEVEARDRPESVLIKIKDSGIGIPPDGLAKVFDEFYRAANAKAIERDGTGLGLTIAKQVVERHNGKIWVESKLGQGSCFYITLPKRAAADVK